MTKRAGHRPALPQALVRVRQFAERADVRVTRVRDRRLGHAFCRPGEMVRHVDRGRAEREHGQDIRLQRVAHHQETGRLDPLAREDAAIHGLVFSDTMSTARKCGFRPDFASLRSWSRRSPFVIRMISCRAATFASVSATPSSNSTGCESMPRPSSISCWISPAGTFPAVSWIAVSMADKVKPLTP